jgi:hypothetical protein
MLTFIFFCRFCGPAFSATAPTSGDASPAPDPKGAFGLSWGETPQAVEGKLRELGWEICSADHFERMTWLLSPSESKLDVTGRDGDDAVHALLVFFEGRLYAVVCDYRDPNEERYGRLRGAFTEKYGEPYRIQLQGQVGWDVGDTHIALTGATPYFAHSVLYTQISVGDQAGEAQARHYENIRSDDLPPSQKTD